MSGWVDRLLEERAKQSKSAEGAFFATIPLDKAPCAFAYLRAHNGGLLHESEPRLHVSEEPRRCHDYLEG